MSEQLGLFDSRRSILEDLSEAPLSVRESNRARRLSLRMLPPHTLELVVPRGTRPARVEAFVAEHGDWIRRARQEIASRYRAGGERLPQRIELAALGSSWRVRFFHAQSRRGSCRESGEELEVRAPAAGDGAARSVLRAWLIELARRSLTPWLLREAERVGRVPRAVQIRLQKTRWGSCSASGAISLNAALLFLEPRLVRYLLVHELCHFHSLNHSARFWKTVERFEPDYRTLDRQLTDAWTLVPLWLHEP